MQGPLLPPTHLRQWYEKNKAFFSPPVCNKLLHKEQLSVMFVGGPNQRTDFHLDEGSEFFYQVTGSRCRCGGSKRLGSARIFTADL